MPIILESFLLTFQQILSFFANETFLILLTGAFIGIISDRRLHQKQVQHKIYDRVADAINAVAPKLFDYIIFLSLYCGESFSEENLSKLNGPRSAFISQMFHQMHFLPSSLTSFFDNELNPLYTRYAQADPPSSAEIMGAGRKFVSLAREAVGMDKLGEDLIENLFRERT